MTETMNLYMKNVAEKLNGREYGSELTEEEADQLKNIGLVVAYGYSDDNIEFRGAYEEEIGYWEKAEIDFVDGEVLCYPCDQFEHCPLWKKEVAKAKTITAQFTGDGLEFKTDIPHEEFTIMEDGEVYGKGIVFAYEDIGGKTDAQDT